MSPRILRRCAICGKFHASYLVEDPQLGTCYLCLSCWKARISVSIEQKLVPAKSTDQTKRSDENTIIPEK
jgi:hypothetical protein